VPNIVVIGASAGGIEVLRSIARSLPRDLQAAIFVVTHMASSTPSVLSKILRCPGGIRVSPAVDGEPIEPSRIYVATPDLHLLVEPGRVRLTRGPRENRQRPAVDPLFRTAAHAYGSRVLGIVLSGLLDDGALGLYIVKSEGGTAMVQDPNEAMFDSMPRKALAIVDVDYVLKAAEMPQVIEDLAKEPWRPVEPERARAVRRQVLGPEDERMSKADDEREMGKPSMFTCPDCSGTLWEVQEGDLTRFRCRVGHAFSPESMRDGYRDDIEGALWTAVRTLEESAAFERKLASLASDRADEKTANRFLDVAASREQQAEIIRELLMKKDESGREAKEIA